MTTEQAPSLEARGAALIPLPGMHPLMTDDQREGRACPWCNTPTTPKSIDLGERELQNAAPIHPVACRRCTNREARTTWVRHRRTCVTCTHDEYCPSSRLLRRLALETRR